MHRSRTGRSLGCLLVATFIFGLSGCARDEDSEPEVVGQENAPTKEDPSDAESVTRVTPNELIEAIRAAGLSVTNARDNTSSCTYETSPQDSCTGLVTTDQVSVYAWPSEDQAMRFTPLSDCSEPEMPTTGGVRCRATLGRYTILIGNDSNFPVPDAQPYVEAAQTLLGI